MVQQLSGFTFARIQQAGLQAIGHSASHRQLHRLLQSMRSARSQIRLYTAGAQRAREQCRHLKHELEAAAQRLEEQRCGLPARMAELDAHDAQEQPD